MIISIAAEKVFDKMQDIFMIKKKKPLNKLSLEQILFNIIKTI